MAGPLGIKRTENRIKQVEILNGQCSDPPQRMDGWDLLDFLDVEEQGSAALALTSRLI
jgi:hypothetical protein